MQKVIRDGMVAVLYSPGYGAGWYTWNRDNEDMMFHPEIVALVEADADAKQITEVAKKIWPHVYCGGADQLQIKWIAQGSAFMVDEYDGSESIDLIEEIPYITA